MKRKTFCYRNIEKNGQLDSTIFFFFIFWVHIFLSRNNYFYCLVCWPCVSTPLAHGIEPTRDWTHFLKIGFVVAGGDFYSYYNLPHIKLDKEKKNVRKQSLIHTLINPVLGSISSLRRCAYQYLNSQKAGEPTNIPTYKMGLSYLVFHPTKYGVSS